MEPYKAAKQTRLEVQNLKDVPPLPLTAQRILKMLEDEALSVEAFTAVIEQDPGLAARLLGLANSAFFGFSGKIDTLEAAIVRVLGFDIVKSLAFSMAMSSEFEARRCPEFALDRYWSVAIVTAITVGTFKREVHGFASGSDKHLYLCGLLHNLGQLALVHCCPDKMGRALKLYAASPGSPLSAAEQQVFGCDHHDAGGWLARKWGLPEVIVNVIEHHFEPDYRGPDAGKARLVGCCAQLANHWMYGEPPSAEGISVALAALGVPPREIDAGYARLQVRLDEIRQTAQQFA